MAITPNFSQPNCHIFLGSYYRGLSVLSFAVETFKSLVLMVLDVHGFLYDPDIGFAGITQLP